MSRGYPRSSINSALLAQNWDVLSPKECFVPVLQRFAVFFGKAALKKALENMVYCDVSRVYKVGIIEAIVSKFVEHKFIGREIAALPLFYCFQGGICPDLQHGFGKGIGVSAVRKVAYR